MSTYAGSSTSAIRSWESRKPNPTLLETGKGLVQQYAVPVAIAGFLVRRFLQKRKQAPKQEDADVKAAKPSPTAPSRRPRREYKVKRDQDEPLLVGADDDEIEVQPHDDVMEGYTEQEVETAGAAAAAPGGGNNAAMLKMLQQMGYRIVMPKDGSGQVFVIPPGASGPGGPGGPVMEGDQEGYDEDEEGFEEGVEDA